MHENEIATIVFNSAVKIHKKVLAPDYWRVLMKIASLMN